MEQSKIDRINELAWKQRTEGLSEEEAQERQALREEYVASVRRSLEFHLENTFIEGEDGEIRPLQKKP